MNKNEIIQNLKILGLDSNEALLYYYLLKKGLQKPLDISKSTGLNRTKIYRIIDKLIKKRLIIESNTKWGKSYKASSPEYLELLIREEQSVINGKKKVVSETINEFQSILLPSNVKFEVRYFRGIEGLKQQYYNVLSSKGDILVFGYRTRNEAVGKKFAEKTRFEQVRKKIKLYEIENPHPNESYSYTHVPNWKKYYFRKRIDKNILKIRHQILIYNDIVSIVNFEHDEKFGMEIHNRNFNLMLSQMFWKFWEIAKN